MAPTADKPHTRKGRCIYAYIYMLLITYIGAKIPRRANPLPVTVEENQEPVVIVHEITYNLSIFSSEQLQKATRSHEAVARFVRLSSDLTWDDVFAQLKIKISDVLFPRQPVVDAGELHRVGWLPPLSLGGCAG